MILDLQEKFSGAVDALGVTTAQGPITATTVSTNVLDARNSATPALVDEGMLTGQFWWEVKVIQAFNTLTSLTITLESDVAATLASAPVVHASVTVALAGLTANTTVVRMPMPSGDFKRYIGVRYTVNGAAPTAGTVLSHFVLDTQRNKIYPVGFTIDA